MDRPAFLVGQKTDSKNQPEESVSSCPWYAELPHEGTGVAARAFAAAPAAYTNFMNMPTTVSTRSLTNDHKIGRPRVPGGPTG